MSWLFSQALVEEYLGDISLDGEQSAPLNGNPTQQAYCAPDKMMGFSKLSRYGMTYKPLTDNHGQELLTLYLAGFHARTSQPLEKEQELTASDQECGKKWLASFVKYDHDSSLWKTHQCSLLGDLEPFLETWPQWGLMRDGECWEQQTLEQTIRGTEYGLSPNGVAKWGGQLSHTQHNRIRRWEQQQESIEKTSMDESSIKGLERYWKYSGKQEIPKFGNSSWWEIEPNFSRVANDVPARVDRLKAIGNGQVPLCAATAWRVLNAGWG